MEAVEVFSKCKLPLVWSSKKSAMVQRERKRNGNPFPGLGGRGEGGPGRKDAHTPLRNTTGLFKAACSTDLLFLIDTICSMDPYLNSAKEQIKSIVKDIKKTFINESDVHEHGDQRSSCLGI